MGVYIFQLPWRVTSAKSTLLQFNNVVVIGAYQYYGCQVSRVSFGFYNSYCLTVFIVLPSKVLEPTKPALDHLQHKSFRKYMYGMPRTKNLHRKLYLLFTIFCEAPYVDTNAAVQWKWQPVEMHTPTHTITHSSPVVLT